MMKKNRKSILTVVIILLLSSSGVWGARLIQSQTQGTDKQQSKTATEQPVRKGTGTPSSYKNVIQERNIQPGSPAPGDPQFIPAPPITPSRTTPARRPSFEPRNQAIPPVSPPSSGPAPAKPYKEEISEDGKQYVTMDFDGVDIKVFVKFIADITGKNFILDDKVSGKVTVISPRKMTLDEAYQVFLSVLDVNGFGTVNMGGVIKVVQAADAITKSISTSKDAPKRREDILVTQIIQLKHSDANEMKTLFTPLLSRGTSQLLSYPQSNVLIITDTKSNIKKMMEILDIIDVAGFGQEVRIIHLSHASATDLSAKLADIISDDKAPQAQRVRTPRQAANLADRGKARIIPYERTNSLIVLSSAIDIEGIESLIKKLDIPTPSGKEDIHVYYLQYANAEDLAKVLTDMPSPAKLEGAAATPDAVQRGMRNVGNSDKIKISPDKETNSLIIYADPDVYTSILETVKYLDIPRKQVYVKAMIMEVNEDNDFKVGVEWTAFEDFVYDGGERVGGVFARTGEGFITSPSGVPSGAILGVVGQAITIGSGDTAVTFPNLTSFINAMAHDTNVKILMTPQIITLDNKEAEITVGQNVPYVTKEDTDSTNINRTVRTFDYRDVGVTLKFTPHINQQGNIRLDLFQESTSLVVGTGDEQYAPTTLKRTAKTSVTVKDGSTMVIGGLIGETLTDGKSRVPLLSKIPILGHLFKSTSRQKERTNLYIFLNPNIIDSDEKNDKLYREKYGEIEDRLNMGKKGKPNENTKP